MPSEYRIRLHGDPILTMPCVRVTAKEDVPDGLIHAMRRICAQPRYGYPPGVGISAPQVGSLAAVILAPINNILATAINPRIRTKSEETELGQEGCLSIPGFYTNVRRHTWVEIEFEDEQFTTLRSRIYKLGARVWQHEIDHLAGKQLTDGLSRQQRRQAERAVIKVLTP